MSARLLFDRNEFIKFLLENGKMNIGEVALTYNVCRATIKEWLLEVAYRRVMTSTGTKYIPVTDINETQRQKVTRERRETPYSRDKNPSPQDENASPHDKNSSVQDNRYTEPQDTYEDIIEYQFFNTEDIAKLRMEVNARMLALSKELTDLNNEITKNGFSDKITQQKKVRITFEIPTGVLTTYNSARMAEASKLSKKKMVEKWTADECSKFLTLENWLTVAAYQYAVNFLLKDDSKSLRVVPCAEGYKKYSRNKAH